MKGGKQRRDEIRARRDFCARVATEKGSGLESSPQQLPPGALPADPDKLLHDNTYGPRPRFYLDRRFCCIECGAWEVWKAADQKWWYEEAKGKIGSIAVRCNPCRRKRRVRRSQERRIHIEGLIAKYGIDTTARRLSLSIEVLERMRARWAEQD